jgi:phosphoserine phosphatase RsbU/P
MAELKGVVHSLARAHASPRDLLVEANRVMSPHLDDQSFITVTYAVLDGAHRRLTYARAGHCPLIVVSTGPDGERRSAVLAPSGMVLGLTLDDGDTFARVLDEERVALQAGDVVVFFTDGISEAMSDTGDYYGEERLVATIEAHAGEAPADIREAILSDLAAFCRGEAQHDDMTMLVLKVTGGQ